MLEVSGIWRNDPYIKVSVSVGFHLETASSARTKTPTRTSTMINVKAATREDTADLTVDLRPTVSTEIPGINTTTVLRKRLIDAIRTTPSLVNLVISDVRKLYKVEGGG